MCRLSWNVGASWNPQSLSRPVMELFYFYLNTSRGSSAQYGCFSSSLISCCPGMLLRYCRSDFEMVPVAPIITGITFAFHIPHSRNIKYSQLLSWSHFYLQDLQHLLTCMFPVYYHGLWYPVYCYQQVSSIILPPGVHYCHRVSTQFQLTNISLSIR